MTPSATDAARLAYEDLSTLDLDAYEGVGLDEIARSLRDLAGRASEAQLQAFLDGPETLPSEFEDKNRLVERYVERRLRTIGELRRLREAFSLPDLA